MSTAVKITPLFRFSKIFLHQINAIQANSPCRKSFFKKIEKIPKKLLTNLQKPDIILKQSGEPLLNKA